MLKADVSVRELATWQFTLSHAMLVTTVLSAFCSSVAWRSGVGVFIFGGAVGLVLTVAAKRRNNAALLIMGLFLLLLTVGTLFVGYCLVGKGSGQPTVLCTFLVTDQQTGSPIPAALVRIRDLSLNTATNWAAPGLQIPPGEAGIADTTNNSGIVTLPYCLPVDSEDSYFAFHARVVVRAYMYLQVSAPGYRPLLVPLSDYAGQDFAWNSRQMPPQKAMTISLERTPSNIGQPQGSPSANQPGG
jgi:hypothetical protein